jgi:hypothetical protein
MTLHVHLAVLGCLGFGSGLHALDTNQGGGNQPTDLK